MPIDIVEYAGNIRQIHLYVYTSVFKVVSALLKYSTEAWITWGILGKIHRKSESWYTYFYDKLQTCKELISLASHAI